MQTTAGRARFDCETLQQIITVGDVGEDIVALRLDRERSVDLLVMTTVDNADSSAADDTIDAVFADPRRLLVGPKLTRLTAEFAFGLVRAHQRRSFSRQLIKALSDNLTSDQSQSDMLHLCPRVAFCCAYVSRVLKIMT